MTSHTGKSPGRPTAAAATDARDALIETAARLFAAQGYEATSLRQVAEGAAVTPAMVSYYFDTKSGLLEAVVTEGLETLLAVLERTVSEAPVGEFLPALVRNYLNTIARLPWIPQILIREVISRDTPLRTLFVERVASRAVAIVPARVVDEIQSGRLREDLDPRFAVLSLIGMCLFPFIAHPVLGHLLGYELNEQFGLAYAEHAVRLFMGGVTAGGYG